MTGRSMRFSVADCPLGQLLVAVGERGVCSVRLGASAAELEAGLRHDLPGVRLERDAAGLAAWAAALVRLAAGRPPGLELPVDLPASPFRGRVWEALRAIPRGQTRSYAEVARALGRPHAARAVGQACAANPVALLVPCHRVVPAAGGVGGYRWGAWRKRALLGAESDPLLRDPCPAAAAAG
jgi:AraC family transcriptional regulator of adaptative response/methylated-DNA-[protein]-cysteine methyltransferase